MAKTPKRTANSKRTPLILQVRHAKAFLSDWDRLSRSGRVDMNRLKEVMLLLVKNDGMLPPEWLDHPLENGTRECHVGGDFLLVYFADDVTITFERSGSHNDIFNR